LRRFAGVSEAGARSRNPELVEGSCRSTAYESHRGYAVHTYIYAKRKMVALTADDIDCIVAYIVPLNLWYVLPVECFSPCKNLWFYPNGSKKGSRFESYREAWSLLAPNLKEIRAEQPT
jgi:hypothetical protein